jgi:hypothetical protein
VISFTLSILFIYYINIMDTSDFRKPRPDVPILPSRAVFRSTPITPFTRPKGRKGRKPKGRPKTTQAQTREFLRIKEADEARKGRELAIKKARDTEAREIESLALQRERLRQDREFRQNQLRIQDFVSQRDFVRAGLDRQQAERQLFLQAQIAQQQANIQVAGQQQQAQIAQQQQQQQAQIANQRGLQALQDRQLREREIGLRQEQLEFGREREEDENIFRASQVARQQQTEQLQQTLEDRRQREARAMYQYFQQSFAESQRRAGENQAQFAQLIADSRNRGTEVSREDFRNLQEQVERLTPKSRPSPAQERKRETTDLRFRGAGGGRTPDQDIEELFDELEARSPESGLEEQLQRSPPSARTITQKLGQRAEFLKQKLTLSPRDKPTEEEQDPLLRQKLQEQTGVGTFTGTATSPTFEERLRQQAQPPQPELSTPEQREIQQALGQALGKKRPPPPPKEAQQPEITPRTAGRFAVYQKLQQPQPEPELEPEPTIAEQVGGAVAGVVGTTAGVVSNVGLGVARGIGGAVAESLPTAGQFGEAIGRAGVGGAKLVGGAVAGGIGALLEEPEPAPVKIEKTPYEQLLELRGSEESKFSLSRKPRGAEFGTFERGDTQYVLSGEIKKGLQGDFAIHTIDPKKKSLVYKDLSKPEAGGAEGGFGSTTWSALDKRVGLGSLEVSKTIIGEEEEAQP